MEPPRCRLCGNDVRALPFWLLFLLATDVRRVEKEGEEEDDGKEEKDKR